MFSLEELEMLIESMTYTKKAFQDYPHYPSYEFRQERLRECQALLDKLRKMKREVKNENSPK